MGFRINTNTAALAAHTSATMNNRSLDSSLNKLNSGFRINSAADDASGMAIADSLRSQANALGQAIMNANDAIGIIQTADKAMDEQIKILDTIKTKAIQAAQDGQTTETRRALQADIGRLMEELDNIGNTTSFNGQKLLSGTFSNKEFQIGAYSNETVKASIGATTSDKIGLTRFETGHNIRANDVIGADAENPSDGKYTLTFKNVDGINDFTLEPVQFAQITKGEDGKSSVDIKAGQGLGALVEAINKASDKTGIKANANVTSVFEHVIEAGETSENFTINGVKIGKISVQHKDSNGALRAAINSVKDQTGVEASVDTKGRLVLSNRDGRGIKVDDTKAVKTAEEIKAYKAELKEASAAAAKKAAMMANSKELHGVKTAAAADTTHTQYDGAANTPGSAYAAGATFGATAVVDQNGQGRTYQATASAAGDAAHSANSMSLKTTDMREAEKAAKDEAGSKKTTGELVTHLKDIQLIAQTENTTAQALNENIANTTLIAGAVTAADSAQMASATSRVTDTAAQATMQQLAKSITNMIEGPNASITNADDIAALKQLAADLIDMAKDQQAIHDAVTDDHMKAIEINGSGSVAAGADVVGTADATHAAGTESLARIKDATLEAKADAKATLDNINKAVKAVDDVFKNLKTKDVNFGYEITGAAGAANPATTEGVHTNTEAQNIFGASSWRTLADATTAGAAPGATGAGDANAADFIGHDGTVLVANNNLGDMKEAHANIDEYLKATAKEVALSAIDGFKGGVSGEVNMKAGGADGKNGVKLGDETALTGNGKGPLAAIVPPKIGALNLQDAINGMDVPLAEDIKNGIAAIQNAENFDDALKAVKDLRAQLTTVEEAATDAATMDTEDAQKAMLAHAYNAFLDGLEEGLNWVSDNVEGLGKESQLADIVGLNEENSVNFGRLSLVSNNGKDIQVEVRDGNGVDMTSAVGYDKNVAEKTVSLRETNAKTDRDVAAAQGFNAEDWMDEDLGENANGYPAGVMTFKGAQAMIDIAETAQKALEAIRSDLGSVQNQLVVTVNNISVTQVNVKTAESNIRDVDFASESATFSKHQILAQSGVYAMSQANAVQQNVMRLLQ